MKKIKFTLLFIFSISVFSSPWIDTFDKNYYEELRILAIECEIDYLGQISNYPISLGEVLHYIKKNRLKELNEECKSKLESEVKRIDDYFNTSQSYIGYQSGYDGLYLQHLGPRYYKNTNTFISHSFQNDNLFFKLKISKDLDSNKTYLDESFGSIRFSNIIFSAGRINRWWSPSENTSLILSNSARPSFGVEIKNYIPISSSNKILGLLGPINYEVFINKLEEDRHIKNALLFGNRVSIKPFPNLDISLIRLAQFGGDGRPTDSKTIINMLIGRDNTSKNLSFEDQPGNQIAGIDFSFSPTNYKNLNLYGQFVGEDEAGFFPSRKLHLSGFRYIFDNLPIRISLESVDTYSGIPNYSYNHPLYKDGLRYRGQALGAAIDADSKDKLASMLYSFSDQLKLNLKYRHASININNSELNSWSPDLLDFNELIFEIDYEIKRMKFELLFLKRNKDTKHFEKNEFLFGIYYKI